MPEFEETQPQSNPSHHYTPSEDAKPRTRRRSGGFKKETGEAPKGHIGEVDAKSALKEEKLSGPAKAEPPRQEKAASKELKPVELKEKPTPRDRAPRSEESANANQPAPSEKTLAAIRRVEARILERKAERDARRAERGETKRPRKQDADSTARPTPGAGQSGSSAEGGLISAITGFFGKLFGSAAEAPARKPSGNRPPQGGPGRSGGRPQGKDGHRAGPNRRGGPNRGRGGKGRNGPGRRQNKGGSRRQPQASRSE